MDYAKLNLVSMSRCTFLSLWLALSRDSVTLLDREHSLARIPKNFPLTKPDNEVETVTSAAGGHAKCRNA